MVKKIAYIFPGQGSQYVGMGKDFYDYCPYSKEVFEEAERVLKGMDIKRLCFEGPLEELTLTSNSQVAILVVSIAGLRALDSILGASRTGFEVSACLGLSLGELTALIAGKGIGFKEGLRLVRRRGELMEDASNRNPGTMAVIIGLSYQDVMDICRLVGADISNLNCPGQIVISGTKSAVKSCLELAKNRGAKKTIPLNVSGPFHSSLMKKASELFKIELEKVRLSIPKIGVISNVTADYVVKEEEIKDNLVQQLYSTVRWEESVRKVFSQGIDTFLEIGPGNVLKGLLRRIEPTLKVYNIEEMEDINSFMEFQKAQISTD